MAAKHPAGLDRCQPAGLAAGAAGVGAAALSFRRGGGILPASMLPAAREQEAPMNRVFAAPMLSTAANVRNALEANGIPCVLKNDRLGLAAGELPPIECWPEVWVENAADEARAREIIEEVSAPEVPGEAPWRCGHCGEEVEAVFGKCWNCGEAHPA
jgi:hypothetical protein